MNKETLIAKLNEDLAGELSAIIQYITYAAKATGPFRPQLTQFFLAEVPDEQMHAQFLANKVVALGGDPASKPRDVAKARSNREINCANQSGVSGRAARTGVGARSMRWASTSARVPPGNGSVPVSISCSISPSAYRSLRASATSPRACSGDR